MEYNPFEKIKEYHSNKKNLFKCDDPQTKAEEILETYHSAVRLGYSLTTIDKNIRFEAIVVKDPSFLEDLAKRMENDEIMDEEGNPVIEF